MTSPLVAVSHDTQIPYVEFQGQAVVTFAMVDKVHCKADGQARRQFDRNRKHFTEGEDFYRVDYAQKCQFDSFEISIPPRGIIVLTESGYLLLVKSFTDDLAWQVQKQLIKVYFRAKAQAAAPAPAPESAPSPQITAADEANIRRIVWLITGRMRHEKTWVFAVWSALRQAAGCPSPHRFEERHLPAIAAELRRILEATEAFLTHCGTLERELCRRVLRGQEPAAPFIAEFQAEEADWLNELRPWVGKIDAWNERDFDALANRTAPDTRWDDRAYAEPAQLAVPAAGGAV